MQLHEALRDAPAFLRNAQETASRSPVNAETLYLWDNQVTAIEQFLANTEEIGRESPDLQKARKELLDLKKAIQLKVLEFELKAEGQELPPEPTEDELVEDLAAFGKEIAQLCREIAKAPIENVKQLEELEEPRQQINAFLADTEPFLGRNEKLTRVRTVAKKTREQIEARVQEVLKAWRQQDLAGGDDDDEG